MEARAAKMNHGAAKKVFNLVHAYNRTTLLLTQL
jgi:hypothetical protein